MKTLYVFTEDNREAFPFLMDKTFTINQLQEIFRDLKAEYLNEYAFFENWFIDMKRSGLIEEVEKSIKTFIIKRNNDKYDITCKNANIYNKYGVEEKELFNTMTEIADVFNNTFDIAVMFEVE